MKFSHVVRSGSTLFLAVGVAACGHDAPAAVSADVAAASVQRDGRGSPNAAAIMARRALPAGLSLDIGTAAAASGAIIDNGVVQLGVFAQGHLNVPGGELSTGLDPTRAVGLRYMPTGSDATAPGCLCEGWGVADAMARVSGHANQHFGGARNLEVESFTHTASTAVSRVLVRHTATGAPWMRVTHDYHPSPATPNIYEVVVTVENVSGQTIQDLRYRRVMDWDIAPNTFNEYVTIQGANAANVRFASNDGFASGNPLDGPSHIGFTGNFVDAGSDDHGALFDFGFGALAAGESKQFVTFYGAAGNERDANFALSQVGAEVYSLGQPSIAYAAGRVSCLPWNPVPHNGAPKGLCGPERGEPNTFVFGFRSVGGPPVFEPRNVTLNISPRPISLSKSNLITVWLPSTSTFDATATVPASATLGDESDLDAAIHVLRGAPYSMTGDFNRDGLVDRAFIFQKADLQATGDLKTTATRLVLRASHTVEGLIRADGPVVVIP